MDRTSFPSSQGQLIKHVRGAATQAEFARRLGVDRTCLSRYESEALGAPTSVLNACLQALAAELNQKAKPPTQLERAIAHARQTLDALEAVAKTAAKK